MVDPIDLSTASDGAAIGDMIVRAFRRYPGRTAFISDGRAITYAETEALVVQALATLDALGTKPGDAVVQFGRNNVEQFALMAACYIGGFRSVTLQPTLHDADRQAEMLAPCEAAIVVYDAAFAGRARELRDRLPNIAHWHCHQATEAEASFWGFAPATASHLINRAQPEDVVRIGFTSGTSEGRPKGVLLSSRALAALTLANLADGDWPHEPRVLCAEAIAGGFGNMIVPTMIRGGTFIVLDGADRTAWIEAVERYRPNIAFLMPWSLNALVADDRVHRTDWSSLALIGYSGAVLSDDVMDKALALFGPILSQIYGQTEYPKALAILGKADHASGDRAKLRSLGLPYSGTRIALLDDDGLPVADGDAGELCVRGQAVFSGYLAEPQRTAAAFRNGWYRTGDLCRQDSAGYLHFADRITDVILRAGRKILPSEIEARLLKIAGVTEAAAVDIVEDGHALIVGFVAGRADAMEIAGAFADAPSLAPDRIAFVPTLPRTLIGRHDRPALRRLWQGGLPHFAVAIPEHFEL